MLFYQVFAKDDDEKKEDSEFYAIMFVVIGVVAGISMAVMSYVFGVSGERLTRRLRDMVFRAYLRQVNPRQQYHTTPHNFTTRVNSLGSSLF